MYRLLGCVLVGLAVCGAGLGEQGKGKDVRKETKTGNEVTGKVMFKGKPLPGGTVAFHPAKGKPVVGRIRVDGTYLLKNAPLGEMAVTVETESARPRPSKGPNLKVPPKIKKLPITTKTPPTYVPIPTKYGNVRTSPLRYEIKRGKQTLDLNLR